MSSLKRKWSNICMKMRRIQNTHTTITLQVACINQALENQSNVYLFVNVA